MMPRARKSRASNHRSAYQPEPAHRWICTLSRNQIEPSSRSGGGLDPSRN
jgi:hypothetical protein